ncbi:MobA/MobL family protein, partial [Escherichia coli]|nr:MobA/MobL family protein [Escherichia coli]
SHAPDWVYDRETLVNEIEKVEKQYNSQLLREIVVALPVDFKNEDQTTLIREYVQENFVSDGMVADVSIHRDQEHNPHAHILLTLRPFNEDGTWWKNKSKKEYILDE